MHVLWTFLVHVPQKTLCYVNKYLIILNQAIDNFTEFPFPISNKIKKDLFS